MCIVAPLISFDRCSSLQWSNYINAHTQVALTLLQCIYREVQYAVSFAWNVTASILNQQHETRPPPCKDTQADDSVRQLYLIPAVLNHVSGGTVQAARTQDASEVDRPDQTTGSRGKHRATSWVCHWTPATLSWPRLPHPWGYFSTGLSLMLASGTKYSTSTALAACSKVTLHTRPSGE